MEVSIPASTDELQDPNLHRMVVLQPGEKVVCIINRHPVGIILEYIGVTLVIMLAGLLALLTVPANATPLVETVFFTGLGILVLVLIIVVGVATKVYWQNHWIITTDSLTQVSQGSLLSAQVSALSLENLEDVTVYQRGFLQHTFHYGTLRAETAGERSKFSFSYCPDPVEYARKIIDAREKFISQTDDKAKR
jgi:hypothetical protein